MCYYFENEQIEKRLDDLIKAVCKSNNKGVSETVFLYEKANFIFSMLSQINHMKIGEEIIDVATRQYSKFFFSELTHQSPGQYIACTEKFYRMLIENIGNGKVSICEIGSGLGKNAFFLSKYTKKVKEYYAIDKNKLIVELNRNFFQTGNVAYILGDAFAQEFPADCDLYFLFHFLKHYPYHIGADLVNALYRKPAEIWVYDTHELVDQIELRLERSAPSLRVNGNFLVIGRTKAVF